MIRSISFIICIIFLFSCKHLSQKKEEKNIVADSVIVVAIDSTETRNIKQFTRDQDPWDAREYAVNIDSLEFYLKIVDTANNRLKASVSKMDSAQIIELIKTSGYLPKDDIVQNLMYVTMPALMRWSGVFGNDYYQPTDSLVIKKLAQAGFQPQYVGEGYTELAIDLHFYMDLLKPYVDSETFAYLEIENIHNDVLFMDAGLVVPYDTLAVRAIRLEHYINKYPHSKFRKEAINEYAHYIKYLLFCTADNSPAYGYESHEVYIVNDIKPLIALHQGTFTADLMQIYIKRVEDNGLRYDKAIEDEISSYIFTKDMKSIEKK